MRVSRYDDIVSTNVVSGVVQNTPYMFIQHEHVDIFGGLSLISHTWATPIRNQILFIYAEGQDGDGRTALKLKFRKYPSIHTNYIISHSTILQYNHNI